MSVIDVLNFTPNQIFIEEKNVFEKEQNVPEHFFYSYQKKPVPIDKEVLVDPSKTIMSKTNAKGIIEYANDYFVELSGYEEYELMGKSHNIVRHPDMPKTIFKIMWENLKDGKNVHTLIKNLTKEGKYYWVLTHFEFKTNVHNEIMSYYSRRKAIPKNLITRVEELYKIVKIIEETKGADLAYSYLKGLLEEKNYTFNELIAERMGVTQATLDYYFADNKMEYTTPVPEQRNGFLSNFFSIF